MSKNNRHTRDEMIHERVNLSKGRKGVYKGEKFVRKANMTLKYTCFNTPSKSDIFEWI